MRTTVLAAVAALISVLFASAAFAAGSPRTEELTDYDGVKLWLRFQHSDELYVAYLDRRDGAVSVAKKHPTPSGATYTTLGREDGVVDQHGQWTTWRASAVTTPSGAVTVTIWRDDEQVLRVTDDGVGNDPITAPGRVGLRSDNARFEVDHLTVHRADSSGHPVGSPLLEDDFTHPDGLLLARHTTTPLAERWQARSGVLHSRRGVAYSGVPDFGREGPRGVRRTRSSQFRMATHDDMPENVTVAARIRTLGMVSSTPGDPVDDGPRLLPPSSPTPTLDDHHVTRLDGRVHAETATAVADELLPNADEAVLVSSAWGPETLPAAAFAASRGAALLVTHPDQLSNATNSWIAERDLSRVWVVGDVPAADDLDVAATRVTGDPQAISVTLAEKLDGDAPVLVSAERWREALPAATLAGHRGSGVLLVDDADDTQLRSHLGTAETVTVAGRGHTPSLFRAAEDAGATVQHAQLANFPLDAELATLAERAGATPDTVVLHNRARRGDALLSSVAAAATGGVSAPVDLDDTSVTADMVDWLDRRRGELTHLHVVDSSDEITSTHLQRYTDAREGRTPAVDAADEVGDGLWSAAHPPERVVVARGDVYADALSGGALAGDDGLLEFVTGPDAPDLPADAQGRIAELAPSAPVTVLGGPNAVSDDVVAALRARGHPVERVAGDDRFETAAAAAQRIADRGTVDEIVIATGRNWPDAAAVGAWSAAHDAPVLLTEVDELPDATRAFLDAHPAADRWAVGGETVVSEQVRDEADAQRVAGADRVETSVELATHLWGRDLGDDTDAFLVAPGWGSPQAWGEVVARSPLAARMDAPVLLTRRDEPHPAVTRYLDRLGYTSSGPHARLWIRGEYAHGGVPRDLDALAGW